MTNINIKPNCSETGKVCYLSSPEAHTALESIMKRKKKSHKYSLNKVYKCPYCNYYHLTKQFVK